MHDRLTDLSWKSDMRTLPLTLSITCLISAASFAVENQKEALYQQLLSASEGPSAVLNRQDNLRLMAVSDRMRPVYYELHNVDAARTSGVDQLYTGGSLGLDFSGDRIDWLGVWDGGRPYNHVELTGRYVQRDMSSSYATHMTHVAGTMIASGVAANARGMAWGAARLNCWDWMGDLGELLSAGQSGLVLVSNHSYGVSAGWYNAVGTWYWNGDPDISEEEDWRFGAYTADSQTMDQIARICPYLLQVRSAGNHPSQTGPEPGGLHYVFVDNQWTASTVVRQPDGGEDGYDSIDYTGTAKNIMTVGSVNDVASWPPEPEDIEHASIAGCGPVDDGRIKPDLCANGLSLYSSYSGESGYARLSGTSMAAPVVTATAAMLQQLYLEGHPDEELLRHGRMLLSASLRGLMCHTAREAGPAPGPDYRFGWGLLDGEAAAKLMLRENETHDVIHELDLYQDSVDTLHVVVTQPNPRASICWTDPAATPVGTVLDSPARMLVNDLDLSILGPEGDSWYPWILDPANPDMPATTGVNVRDNIEVCSTALAVGDTCYVLVSHTGALQNGHQQYSLILDGFSTLSSARMVLQTPPAAIGDTLEAALMLEHGRPFNSLHLQFLYDAAKLELVQVENGPVLTSTPEVEDLPVGGVNLQWNSSTEFSGWCGQRELVTLRFVVRADGRCTLTPVLQTTDEQDELVCALNVEYSELSLYGNDSLMPCHVSLETPSPYSGLGDYIFVDVILSPVSHLRVLYMHLELDFGLEYYGAWNAGIFDQNIIAIQQANALDLALLSTGDVDLVQEKTVAILVFRRTSIQTFALTPSTLNLSAGNPILKYLPIPNVTNLVWRIDDNLPATEPVDSSGLPEQLVAPRLMELHLEDLHPVD